MKGRNDAEDRQIDVARADGYEIGPTSIDPILSHRPLFSYASGVTGLGVPGDAVASLVSPDA